jgi:hypothetical protein
VKGCRAVGCEEESGGGKRRNDNGDIERRRVYIHPEIQLQSRCGVEVWKSAKTHIHVGKMQKTYFGMYVIYEDFESKPEKMAGGVFFSEIPISSFIPSLTVTNGPHKLGNARAVQVFDGVDASVSEASCQRQLQKVLA